MNVMPFKTLLMDRGLPGLVTDTCLVHWKGEDREGYVVEWYSDYYTRVHDTWTFHPWESEKFQTLVVPPWHDIFLRHGFPPKYKRHISVDWDQIDHNFASDLKNVVAYWEEKGNHNWRQLVDGLVVKTYALSESDTNDYTLDLIYALKRMSWMK